MPTPRYTPSVSPLLWQINWTRKLYTFITPAWTQCSHRQCLHFCELLGKIGRNKGSYVCIDIQSRTSNLGEASEASRTLFYTGELFTGLCINCSSNWLYSTTSCLLCVMQLCLRVDHSMKSSWNCAQENDGTGSDQRTIKPCILYPSGGCFGRAEGEGGWEQWFKE